MSYTSNPFAPRARREAINLVRQRGWTKAQAARYTGVHRSTIGRWLARAPRHAASVIPTKSSRPHHPAGTLDPAIVRRIIELRYQYRRCAPVLVAYLIREGIRVSLSSVERTLKRHDLTRKQGRHGRYRKSLPRPRAEAPGDLVQADTIHFVGNNGKRFYIYTLIDLYSRWAYAEYHTKLSHQTSVGFVLRAQEKAGFAFQMVQADNGPEWSRWFSDQMHYRGIPVRHSRVRQCNDNAHIERFNRTLQEEGVGRWPTPQLLPALIKEYLDYYNEERLHLGLNLVCPRQAIVAKVLT